MSKKLYKSNDNKMIDGVCAGIAEYFGIDPTLIRLGWVVCLYPQHLRSNSTVKKYDKIIIFKTLELYF